jgi:hypothetical protein
MTESQRGTSDVTLRAWLLADRNGGGSGAYAVLQRFAAGAQRNGTLVYAESPAWDWVPDPHEPDQEPPVLRLTLRYRHTCKNRWNHESDARRFFNNALRVGANDEWAGDVLTVTLNSWTAA